MDDGVPGGSRARLRWHERLSRSRAFVPNLAVVAVVLAAVAATVAVTAQREGRQGAPAVSRASPDFVRAPPLVVKAPPLTAATNAAGSRRNSTDGTQMGSNALNAGRACRRCGVVESVAVLNRPAGYRMRIRMDDGTVRTVAQRGALAAGSRVVLEGGSVRIMPGTRQG